MKPQNLFLVTIILTVVINDFKAEQTTTLDEPLQKLTLISHLLNSIAIRNGFQSGYPNIHTGVAEILKIPKRNSLLKFLDLDVASTMKLFEEFNNSMGTIKITGTDGSDGMLKLIRSLSWVKRYQGRLRDEKFEKAKEAIDKYQETLDEAKKNFVGVRWTGFSSLIESLNSIESTYDRGLADELYLSSKDLKNDIDAYLEHRKKFKKFFDLKNAIRTFKIVLELSKELNDAQTEDFQSYLSSVKSSNSSVSSWSSEHNSQLFKIPMEFRQFINSLSHMVPAPNQKELSISYSATRNIKKELGNNWLIESITAKNWSLENLNVELNPVFQFFDAISVIQPKWEEEIIQEFSKAFKNYTNQADQISEILKYGNRNFNFREADITCLQGFGKFDKVSETIHGNVTESLKYLERRLNEVDGKIRKFVFDIPEDVFEKTLIKFEPRNFLLQNATLNLPGLWELTQKWSKESPEDFIYVKESLKRIHKSIEDLSSSTATTFTPPTPPNIIFSSDSFKNLLKSTNISKVVNCTDESSLSNMGKLIRFLNNVHYIQGAQPTLSKTLNLMERAAGFQERIRSLIDDAIDSRKSRFQRIQNIQNTAEDVSHGIRSLRNIQKLLQNSDSIKNLTQNLQNLPDFNNDDRIKIVNLWRELQDYNSTLASFPTDSNFSDLWSTVLQEAMKIRDVDFNLDQIEHLELPISENRDKIHLALKAFPEVETILERVLGPEEEEKVVGNTIKQGFTAKFTPIPHKSSFAYNLFKIYYLEIAFVVTIASFPIGFWLYERSKEIVLNSN